MSLRSLCIACALLVLGGAPPSPATQPKILRVELERAVVERATRAHALGDRTVDSPETLVDFIRIDFSGDVNLLAEMDRRGRMLQGRCLVQGAADGRGYSDTVYALYLHGVDLAWTAPEKLDEARKLGPSADGRFHYTLHAFIGLEADDEKYIDGKPRGTLDLRKQEFERLGCFIRGAQMISFNFPRTNTLWMTRDEVRAGVTRLANPQRL